VQGAESALMLAGAAALAAPLGLEGVALAWLGATAIAQLAVLPSLVKFFRSPDAAVAPAPAAAEARPEEIALP